MAVSHAFLDILANAPLRDAYLAGRVTLLLSADMETVLWANGAGARFMGFATVAESLAAPCRFDAVLRRRVEEAVAGGVAFLLPGAGQAHRFLASRLRLAPWGEVAFLRSVAAAVGRNGLVDLTDGLSDETSEAALFDLSGRIMSADKDFDLAHAREPGLRPLLAEAFHDGGVKKRLLGAKKPYPVGVLRLSKEPPVFLMIAARRPPGETKPADKTNEVINIMRDDESGAKETGNRHLSPQEQEAFAAIAQRLQQTLKSEKKQEQSEAVTAPAAGGEAVFAGRAAAAPNAAGAQSRAAAAESPESFDKTAELPAEQKSAAKAGPDKDAVVPPAAAAAIILPAAAGAAARPAESPAGGKQEAVKAADRPAAAAPGRNEALKAANIADLQYQKDRLDFLLNVVSEAVLVIDKTGLVRSANAAAARLFGYQAGALPGRPAAILLAAPAAAALQQDIKQAEGQKAGVFLNPGREAEGRTAQGGPVKLRLNFGCVEPGKSYFLLMRDMTRFHDIIATLLRKNNEEAQTALRQSRYFALVSHEIRTPLNAILGMAQFMASGQAGPLANSKYKEYLADILRAGEHIMTLVNDMVQIAGNKTEWLKMDRQAVSITAVLDEVLSLMIPQANAANIIMRSSLAADLPKVWADSRAVRQILLNLLGNAVHFTPAGGQIIISAHELPEQTDGVMPALPASHEEAGTGSLTAASARRCLLLRISDTGVGMSAGQIAHSLRDPLDFVQTDSNINKAEEQENKAETAANAAVGRQGAGLGLPMAYALAEANNIRLSLTSEQGKGTIAALLFPVMAGVNAGAGAGAK
ncbi:two-component system sensor histidine kinase NtrB [Candidatus Tokpelaia sp.]|uniref:two-component system sensor histidine kinase NtrB n=1 Tax=Candidatus Tokpelaia sp. TaxID=2233777 RepID=UPI00123A7780|nr:histidine kinase dimerization/phospho-acceptor domain-containing protein [Candidatus Tokpelaia sp.]KAA6406278.1 hypothetical protein DPQ22_00195 [Candidatus Tokpelaia sp.]